MALGTRLGVVGQVGLRQHAVQHARQLLLAVALLQLKFFVARGSHVFVQQGAVLLGSNSGRQSHRLTLRALGTAS